ncbi:unnamed protein product [Mucor hiemalis]
MSSPYGQQGGEAGQYYAAPPQQQGGYYPPPQGQQPYYQPQPQPQTVYIQQERPKEDHSCCWGCLVAMCICCALDEIC